MPANKLRALIALDIDLTNSLNQAWAKGLLSYFYADGIVIDFLSRSPEPGDFEDSIQHLCNKVIPAQMHSGEDSLDKRGIPPRYRARQIIAIAKSENYDIILAQGLWLNRFLAGGKTLQTKLWAICDDFPYLNAKLTPQEFQQIETIASGAKLLLTGSPTRRGTIESRVPRSTSKTRLLPAFNLEIEHSRHNKKIEPAIVYDTIVGLDALSTLDFRSMVSEAAPLRNPPRIVLTSVSDPKSEALLEVLKSTGLNDYPGLQIASEATAQCNYIGDGSILLTPHKLTNSATKYFEEISGLRKTKQWWPESHMPSLLSVSEIKSTTDTGRVQSTVPRASEYFKSDIADYSRVPLREKSTKVLLVGADFKFAGDLVDALIQRKDIELRVDLFEANAKPQPEESQKLLPWADIIIAEFASYNAIWYSQNLLPHQKLIVHLHGYELLQPWIDELVIDNCEKIVFASHFYKKKAISLKDWPQDKLHVISNSVNFGDLDRKKDDEARFHIGLVGIVPILKRPDRALSLLTELIKSDPRYVLHIKGHAPWNYAWEWKKAAHQDSYRAFYATIANNPEILSRVIFEPFSPDIGNWLQNIGWLLSPSYRETFHLSAIEGAASGAIPLAWLREGSREIIGEDYNFSDTYSVAQFIVSTNSSQASFASASDKAKRSAERYGVSKVRADWLELIFELASSMPEQIEAKHSVPPREQLVLDQVFAAAEKMDFDAALAVLDNNIPLTRSNKGLLKNVEMYIRGLLSIDESRFNRFLPASPCTTTSGQQTQPHLVRSAGPAPLGAIWSGLTRLETLVDLPAFTTESEDSPTPTNNGFDELETPNSVIHTPRTIRLDRAVHLAKSHVLIDLTRNQSTSVVAMGSWLVALPAFLAADQLGLPCTWVVDDPQVWEYQSLADEQDQTNNYVAHTVRSLFERADIRIATAAAITDETPIEHLDACLSSGEVQVSGLDVLRWSQLPEFLNESRVSTRNDQGIPELGIELAEARLGVASGQAFFSFVQNVCPKAVSITPSDMEKSISPRYDAVLVHGSVLDSDDWKPTLTSSKGESTLPMTTFFDKCRVSGVTSIFIRDTDTTPCAREVAVLRKVDHIAASNLSSIAEMLSLHPISTKTVQPLVDTRDAEFAITTLLRGAGIPVHPRTLADAVSEEVQDGELSFLELLPEKDRFEEDCQSQEEVTVFFPKTEEQHANHFVRVQGLPSTLVKLNPIALPSDIVDSNEKKAILFKQALLSDSKGYACVLGSLQDIPNGYLRSLWLNASPDVVVREARSEYESNSLLIADSSELGFGDIFAPASLQNGSQKKMVVHVGIPS